MNYDFQSAGEFVLLRDEDLEIQARQTAVARPAPWRRRSHRALLLRQRERRRGGAGRPHRITYQPNLSGKPDPEGLELRIDGKLTKMSAARNSSRRRAGGLSERPRRAASRSKRRAAPAWSSRRIGGRTTRSGT